MFFDTDSKSGFGIPIDPPSGAGATQTVTTESQPNAPPFTATRLNFGEDPQYPNDFVFKVEGLAMDEMLSIALTSTHYMPPGSKYVRSH